VRARELREGEVAPLPGLRGVRSLLHCAVCGGHREVEGWRVERRAWVEWRWAPVEGAAPVCGACLVRALVLLVTCSAANFEAGRGGAWLRRRSRDGARVDAMGPRCWRRALALGLVSRVSALAHLRGLVDREGDQK
jgi:hypothetical protein